MRHFLGLLISYNTEAQTFTCETISFAVRFDSSHYYPCLIPTCVDSALTCNNDFEGGGWALVRRVKKGSVWFAANDNLRGTAEYGLQNSRINDNSAFSIPYATNVWPGTEFLFMTGMIVVRIPLVLWFILARSGTGDKFLITNWDAISAGGSFFVGLDRRIVKSSASSSSCMTSSSAIRDRFAQRIVFLQIPRSGGTRKTIEAILPFTCMLSYWDLLTPPMATNCFLFFFRSGPSTQTDLLYAACLS
jgi:hypothetical protein